MSTINSWSNDARDIDLIAILTPGRSVGAVSHSGAVIAAMDGSMAIENEVPPV